MTSPIDDLPRRLTAHQRELLEAENPRFSTNEMARRRAELTEAMLARGASHILISGGDRRGSAMQWLSGWPPGAQHYLVFTPGEQDAIFVKNPNNAPLARILAPDARVDWSAQGSTTLAVEELLRRGAKGQGVGVIGSYSHALHERLSAAELRPIDMSRDYTRLRLIKSEEELEWTRIGCAMTDAAVEALERHVRPGMTEYELADIIERAYVRWGGLNQIHYTGVTSMTEPGCCVPSQMARNRKVQAGDAIFTEIATSFWSYPGQIQRTIAVEADPSPLFKAMHDVAEASLDAIFGVMRHGTTMDEILDAASVIDRSDFTICDDLVHGYVGGYLPPVLGTRARPSAPVPNITLQEGMCIVVQPSIMTRDGKAGLQTGETVLIRRNGIERLHKAPGGFRRSGAA
jgi:Xaa-Pro dipeptidase